MILDTHWPRLFGIRKGHALTVQSERSSNSASAARSTRWFVERDAAGNVVARYRSWTLRASAPPWRDQLGWERYAPDGSLEVREVRYASARRPASDATGGWLN